MLGMTVMNARGFGRQKGDAKTEEETIRLLPKLKLEILVMQKDEDRVMDAIGNALRTGEIGDGKIIIFPVVTVMRVRTGERSASALF
jgi:nitrogen regulatory protein PII